MTQAAVAANHSRKRQVGASTFIVAVGLPIAAILTAEHRDVEIMPSLIDWIFVAGVAVTTIAVFGLLVPWALRRPNVATAALTLSVTAAALLVVFWTMLPLILGTAGAWLGLVARDTPDHLGPRSRQATAAIALGALAAILSIAGYVATS
jgi:hypothetical protein